MSSSRYVFNRNSEEEGDMKYKEWNLGLLAGFLLLCSLRESSAIEIVSPVEGARVEVGSTLLIQVRPLPGEKWLVVEEIFGGSLPFNPTTGVFERIDHISKDVKTGPDTITIGATDQQGNEVVLTRRIEFILPPTTTVQSINASQLGNKGKKRLFLSLELTPQKKVFSDRKDRIEVRGVYSDGVERDITMDSKTIYTSMDEKIVKVVLNQDWMWVTPVGPGKTEIVVSNGPHQDRLQVVVDEVVCRDEGDGYRCPF